MPSLFLLLPCFCCHLLALSRPRLLSISASQWTRSTVGKTKYSFSLSCSWGKTLKKRKVDRWNMEEWNLKKKTHQQGGPCLWFVCNLYVHVYVYTFPLAIFQFCVPLRGSNVRATLCFDSVRFVSRLLSGGGSSRPASHMFTHTDNSRQPIWK